MALYSDITVLFQFLSRYLEDRAKSPSLNRRDCPRCSHYCHQDWSPWPKADRRLWARSECRLHCPENPYGSPFGNRPDFLGLKPLIRRDWSPLRRAAACPAPVSFQPLSPYLEDPYA